MQDLLREVFGKLTKYDWITTLIPGLFFVGLANWLGLDFRAKSCFGNLTVVFFCGLVCSRVGATVVEGVAKIKRFKLFASYEDYVDWSKGDPTSAGMLVQNSNWFRSLTGMMLVLIVLYAGRELSVHFHFLSSAKHLFVLIALLVLFADSYRRQLLFTTKRINKMKKASNPV